MALDLGKQVGPLPLGAWVVVVAGGLGVAYYTRKSGTGSGSGDSGDTAIDVTGNPGVGDGSVGGFTYQPSSPLPSTSGSTAPATNEEWGRQAINWLLGHNYDAGLSDSAIRKYLSGVDLSVSENVLKDMALIALGSPPSPLPIPDGSGTPPANTPVTGGSKPPASTPTPVTPKPVTNTPKPAPTAQRYKAKYTVRHGDNLWNIAKKYYGTGTRWGTIYSANRKGVRRVDGTTGMISSPSHIETGWVLIIP